MRRTHRCGELRAENVGQRVVLQGWVHRQRDHGGLIFIDLRDRDGWTQVVFNPQLAPEAHEVASTVRSEYVIEVEGEVLHRPEGTVNPDIPTGDIELAANRIEVINPSLPLPFAIAEDGVVDEAVRLTYRYLDLRRPRMARNLILRHRITKAIRDFFDERGFLEVETPILTKSTPEGARDYLVPSRVHPNSFYALPQAPQQFKQLLMVAGVDRYFQIARCFRDEDQRADRQPEFTQLDVEMSFVDQDDVLGVMEDLFTELSGSLTNKRITTPFPRLKFQEAMARYGSDKPDLRYGMASEDLSDLFAETEFGVFRNALGRGAQIRGMRVEGGAAYSRRVIDELTEIAKSQGAGGLAWAAVEPGELRSSFARFLSEGEKAAMLERLGAREGDLILLVAETAPVPSVALGAIRVEVAKRENLADPNELAFARVTEFPLFDWDEANQRWDAVHHPFTSPVSDDLNPETAKARAYDVILNGFELGGGSIRIHRPDVQRRVFEAIGLTTEEAEEKFGFLLQAFRFGVPPHGGIALGLDRLVMLLAGRDNIREVIAFPKTQSGQDPLTGAPGAVTEAQLRELGLRPIPQTR